MNNHYIALIVAGGSGNRSGLNIPKQYAPLLGRSVLGHSVATFAADPACTRIYIAITPDHRAQCQAAVAGVAPDKVALIETSGETRQATVRRSLEYLLAQKTLAGTTTVLVHDAARPCLRQTLIAALMAPRAQGAEAVVPAIALGDTLRRIDRATGAATEVDRSGIHAIQTPQAFDALMLHELHQRYQGETFTDDAALFARAGITPVYVAGERDNIKITYPEDMAHAMAALSAERGDIRSASGYDVHEFTAATPDRPLRLGGVTIAHDKALAGHSDADAVLHAVTDALLGCISAQDIGYHFSPADARWHNADSMQFLAHARDMVAAQGGLITHVDVTVVCEEPKIGPHRAAMQAAIAQTLCLTPDRVSIKATTSEGLGFTGRREGLAASATATVRLPFHPTAMQKDHSHAA